jgi:hypothetical protein
MIKINQVKLNKVAIVDIILTVQELQNDKAKLAMWLTSTDDEERRAELIMKRNKNV